MRWTRETAVASAVSWHRGSQDDSTSGERIRTLRSRIRSVALSSSRDSSATSRTAARPSSSEPVSWTSVSRIVAETSSVSRSRSPSRDANPAAARRSHIQLEARRQGLGDAGRRRLARREAQPRRCSSLHPAVVATRFRLAAKRRCRETRVCGRGREGGSTSPSKRSVVPQGRGNCDLLARDPLRGRCGRRRRLSVPGTRKPDSTAARSRHHRRQRLRSRWPHLHGLRDGRTRPAREHLHVRG
jgi:hypothetical protein